MCTQNSRSPPQPHLDPARERRLALLIRRLPGRLQTMVHWLRRPSSRWVRIPAGLLFVLGGVFSILPVLGLWMLPLGLVLLAEDVALLRRGTDRVLSWMERRRPHWMGLPRHSEQAAEPKAAETPPQHHRPSGK